MKGQKYYHAALMSASAVIDSLEFARAGQKSSGLLPVSSFSRLEDVVVDQSGEVAYEVTGSRDGRNRPLLRLRIRGRLMLRCQRCLGALEHSVDLMSTILVVPEGTTPDDAEDPHGPDYIEAERELDLAQLIEDEVLLCVPYAPRHESDCTDDSRSGNEGAARSSPFASLAALKNTRKT